MLTFRLCGVPCRISLLFPALLTALLFYQPEGLAVTCLLASLMHEVGHLLAMLWWRVPPKECVLGLFGMRIRLGAHLTEYGRNIVVALAGPVVNAIAAAMLWQWGVQQMAMVHLLLAGLNLLPVAVLDGGEVLRNFLCLCGCHSSTDRVVEMVSLLVLLPISLLGLHLLLQGNPTLLIVAVYLVVMIIFSDKNEKST